MWDYYKTNYEVFNNKFNTYKWVDGWMDGQMIERYLICMSKLQKNFSLKLSNIF